uniref:Uncharacterized protein n=1 Tax=Oryza meridionalis TaxID=40149 RepID=A0A0E0EMS8_9ORYZ
MCPYGMRWHTGEPPGLVPRSLNETCSGFHRDVSVWHTVATVTAAPTSPPPPPRREPSISTIGAPPRGSVDASAATSRVPSAAMAPSTRASSDVAQNLDSPARVGHSHVRSVSLMPAASAVSGATPNSARTAGSAAAVNGMESATRRGRKPSADVVAAGK